MPGATAGRRPATTGTLPGSTRCADSSPQLPSGPSSAKVSPRMRKRFYLTTAIDYVNGEPHLGHAYEKIVADVIARARRSLGEEVFFLTGLDEHGQKVQQAALDSGKKPQAYCDDLAAVWKGFAKKLNLSNDDFVRTSEPRHQTAVQAILSKLNAAGHFYKAQYRGFYSLKEETFLTEKDRRADRTFDEKFVTYVWFDALVNYISVPAAQGDPAVLAALKSEIRNPKSEIELWPADVHVIGKDILKFHAVYWPITLRAIGLPLPKQILVHGWWQKDGQKMSKSTGNVVDPVAIVDEWGVDAFRYYVVRELDIGPDGNWTDAGFAARYKAELADGIGNLQVQPCSARRTRR